MTDDPALRGEVTRLLAMARAGDPGAVDRLFPLVYEELRRLARARLRGAGAGATLEATGLVHEAYFKLVATSSIPAENRAHFMGIAARAMRQVLVDRARSRGAAKRGGDRAPVTLMDGHAAVEVDPIQILALDRALAELAPRQRQVVEARFFGGLEEREIAEMLGVSERTVRREWVKARAWLVRALATADPGTTTPAAPS